MEHLAYGLRMPSGGHKGGYIPPYETKRASSQASLASVATWNTPKRTAHSPMPKQDPIGAPAIGNSSSVFSQFFQRLWNFMMAAS